MTATTLAIPNQILDIIKAGRIEDNKYFLPPQQLDRKTYTDVDLILKECGAKWNRSAKAHLLDSKAEQRIKEICESGSYHNKKKQDNYFPTPPDLAYYMAEQLDLAPNYPKHCRILEPSAGSGNLIRPLLERITTGDRIDVCEINEDHHPDLQALGVDIVANDFLSYKPEHKYDVIIANPPFSKQQDIAHVTHMLSMLKEDGQLISVMSPSFTFREDKKTKAFKALLDQWGYEVETLPANSFKASGTGVQTVLLRINV